jgi:hypothetical protein
MDAYRIKSMGFCYKKMNFMGKKVFRESGGGEGRCGWERWSSLLG